ncbi:YoaK family protein [Nibricoccus aquaticus]|nr:YoaK family protein [Nibricoccus aquaticus]
MGAFLLTLGAGAVNAIGFLGVHHQGISHLTGTISLVSTRVAAANWEGAVAAGLIVGSFFFGSFLSAVIIRQNTLHMGRRYGVVLVMESALLFGAVYLFEGGTVAGAYLASMACGLQNAMATSYSGAVIRSTHMTGIVTDIGIACGHWVRGHPVDWFRMRLYGVLLGGFALGGVAGAAGYARIGYRTLVFPAVLSGVSGLGYATYKHWQRMKHRAGSAVQ